MIEKKSSQADEWLIQFQFVPGTFQYRSPSSFAKGPVPVYFQGLVSWLIVLFLYLAVGT